MAGGLDGRSAFVTGAARGLGKAVAFAMLAAGGRVTPSEIGHDTSSIDVLAAMIHRLRTTVDGVRLDRYIRIEARLGRPFFLLEGDH